MGKNRMIMPEDISLIIIPTASLILFIVLQIIVFRLASPGKEISILGNLIVMTCLIQSCVTFFIFNQNFGEFLISLLILLCQIYLYITYVFGFALTSVRLNILTLISSQGKQGISGAELSKSYGRNTIVKNRLDRLKGSGVIRYNNGKYSLSGKTTPYLLNVYFQKLLKKIFA